MIDEAECQCLAAKAPEVIERFGDAPDEEKR
jgi:hypothetical protein